jgi:hypothetical protein
MRLCGWSLRIRFSQLHQLANPKSQAPSTKQIQTPLAEGASGFSVGKYFLEDLVL